MMTCQELVELTTAYLEGALDGRERARFEEHLGVCPPCVMYLEQIRETVALTGSLREEDLEEGVKERLLDAFRTWKTSGEA